MPELDQIETIGGLTAVPIPHCNLGHTTPPQHLWDKDGFGYYHCTECGLVWVSPQLTDDSVAQIYASAFGDKLSTRQNPTNFVAYQSRLKQLHPYRQTNRLLDVGCFTGNFLLAAQESSWEQVEGTEISQPAVEYARNERGLTVHHGDLTTLDLPHNAYDVVTLSDVIEHVSDPLATIRSVHQLLRPGGAIYMDTPHFRSVPYFILRDQWSVFFPWHRTYFSVNNMRLALEDAGFAVKHIQAVGVLPFNRFNAWRAYQSAQKIQPDSGLKNASFVKRYKNYLRPLWLTFKSAQDAPFALLSRMGIHIGAKLVVYAEKRAE